jgi:hypothetical protein
MNKEYWVIYMIDFSDPISSSRFGRDDIDFRVLKIVEGTSKEAEKVALRYMTVKTIGKSIKWQKVEDGLTRC